MLKLPLVSAEPSKVSGWSAAGERASIHVQGLRLAATVAVVGGQVVAVGTGFELERLDIRASWLAPNVTDVGAGVVAGERPACRSPPPPSMVSPAPKRGAHVRTYPAADAAADGPCRCRRQRGRRRWRDRTRRLPCRNADQALPPVSTSLPAPAVKSQRSRRSPPSRRRSGFRWRPSPDASTARASLAAATLPSSLVRL